jgi:hypothetical protein
LRALGSYTAPCTMSNDPLIRSILQSLAERLRLDGGRYTVRCLHDAALGNS